MTAQRHRVCRQILEVTIPDRAAAWPLQSQLSRMATEQLTDVLDRCFSESCPPDQLHRIDSLEVDLGVIDLDNLEYELVAKLGPALRQALAQQRDEQPAAQRGGDVQASARLELVACFLMTGQLPWWADATQPRLVDQTVELLLKHAAGPLLQLVRELLGERGKVLRLVRHCADARLLALAVALLGAERPDGPTGLAELSAELSAELPVLVRAPAALPMVSPTRFRESVWLGALRAAGREPGGSSVDFWREALTELAVEAGVTYAAVLAGLPGRCGVIPWVLAMRELGLGSKSPGEALGDAERKQEGGAAPRPAAEGTTRAEAAAGATERDATFPTSERGVGLLTGSGLADLTGRDTSNSQDARDFIDARDSRKRVEARDRVDSRASVNPLEGRDLSGSRDSVLAEQSERILTRLERDNGPLAELGRELRAAVEQAAVEQQGAVLALLTELDKVAATAGLPPAPSAPGLARALGQLAPGLAATVWDRYRAALGQPAAPVGRRETPEQLGELRRAGSAPTPEAGSAEHLEARGYMDADEVYVENAGLVLLWPFLGHLFERLELLADKQFKDRGCLHRAVGLLQHLDTGESEPAEYQLTLAKVLCGMPLGEVEDFGPPVTAREAEECTNLLQAAIAHAPILGEMSIDEFRRSFLIRKGVLSTRDGAWLLRVERAAHDGLLDRLPWTLSWVKLPWSETALAVQW